MIIEKQTDILSIFSREQKNLFNENVFNFREKQFGQLKSMIDKKCTEFNIEGKIRFIESELYEGSKKSRTVNLEGISQTFFVNLKFLLEEEEEVELDVEIPKLINGSYFMLKGVRYFFMLSFNNERPAIHNNNNILFRTSNSKFKLIFGSTLNFELFSKKVPFHIPMLILNNFNFEMLLNDVFGGNSWFIHLEKPTKAIDPSKWVHLGKSEYLIIRSEYLTKFQTLVLASIKRVKGFNKSDYESPEICFDKFVSFFSKTKSEKSKLFAFLFKNLVSEIDDVYNFIFREIELFLSGNVNNNSTDYRELTYMSNILHPLFAGLHERRLTYVNSHIKDRDKLKQIFNKTKLNNIVIKKLLTSNLLQYDDSTRAVSTFNSLKVSLTPASGQAVSAESRDLDESYVGLVDLFASPNGDSTGLTTYLSPTSNHEVFIDEYGKVVKFNIIKGDSENSKDSTKATISKKEQDILSSYKGI